jgi:phosphate-selective porin OprO and OprP
MGSLRGASLSLASVCVLAMSSPALPAENLDSRLRELEQRIQDLTRELEAVKRAASEEAAARAAQEQRAPATPVEAAKPAPAAPAMAAAAPEIRTTINNGRTTFATSDGRFSASLRALVQFDAAYYAQERPAAAQDRSSGTNFRRARIGVEGTLFTDWFYSFLFDMGGTGVEGSRLSDAYLQYNGFAPLRFRTGSYGTPQGLEDQTGVGDLIFAERAAPADIARNIAAADGRQNLITVFANGDDYYVAASISGQRAGDASFFDEQQALVTRGAVRLHGDRDSNVVINGTTTYVYKVADAGASPAGASPLTLAALPEHSVDATRLISTGAVNADGLFSWGAEAAANYRNFYVQGGYFDFTIYRRDSALADPSFDGWYAQGTWVLTGEPRRFNPAMQTWQAPAPAKVFAPQDGGWGAFEVAARYSWTDLDYRAGAVGTGTPVGGIRGGTQSAWTVGLNWYPNAAVRFLLDYQNVDVDRLSAAAPYAEIGQTIDIFSLRSQVAF